MIEHEDFCCHCTDTNIMILVKYCLLLLLFVICFKKLYQKWKANIIMKLTQYDYLTHRNSLILKTCNLPSFWERLLSCSIEGLWLVTNGSDAMLSKNTSKLLHCHWLIYRRGRWPRFLRERIGQPTLPCCWVSQVDGDRRIEVERLGKDVANNGNITFLNILCLPIPSIWLFSTLFT